MQADNIPLLSAVVVHKRVKDRSEQIIRIVIEMPE
jgi:hypothetical protein